MPLQDFAYGVVRFFGALRDFFSDLRDFCRDFPSIWRRQSGKQKADIIINLSILAIYIACLVGIYPVAHRLSQASPSWMPMSDAPLLQTIFYTMMLGSLALTVICLAVGLVLYLIHYAMRGRKT